MHQRVLFIVIVFLAVANLLTWGLLGLERAYAQRVYPGVVVHAEPLAGLTKDQVIDRIQPINETMLTEKVTLVLAAKTYEPTLAELGYSIDSAAMAEAALALGRGPDLKTLIANIFEYQKTKTIPLVYSIDQGVFDNYLNDIGKDIIREPKSLVLAYKDGQIATIPGEEGVLLDKEKLRSAIQEEVQPGKVARIVLHYETVQPEISQESQAKAAKSQLALLLKPLKLQAEEVVSELSPETIFSFVYFETIDNALTVKIDANKVRAALANFAKKVDINPSPKRISAVDGTTVEEGTDGRELNVPDATKRIMERLEQADMSTPIVLSTQKLERRTVMYSPEYQLGRFASRYIEIDLSTQRLHLLEGDNYHKTFLISTGKWGTPTPLGEFEVRNHIRTAFSKRYGLYMDYWMAITSDGAYGLHQLPRWPSGKVEGTSHLGRPVSHGCIRLGPGDAEYLYSWAQNGTKIVIHE